MEMSIERVIELGASVFITVGGIETIKWFFNRKTNKRINEASAKEAELSAKDKEFQSWEKRVEIAEAHNAQLTDRWHKEMDRYNEQTLLVRKQNAQLLERADIIADLKSEISALKAERAMKLCERKGCGKRIPQSGY